MKSRACALAMMVALPAGATTMVRVGTDDLTHQADAIVRGSVTRIEPHWTGDHRRIVTDIEVKVSEGLKGETSEIITVTQLGGTVGRIGQRVGGVARFSIGEEVLLFLERRGPRFILAGMAQGKRHIERASDGSIVALPEPVEDATLVDPSTRQPAPATSQVLKLDDLKAQIQAALSSPPGERAKPGLNRLP